MAPDAHISHRTSERLRIRVPSRKRDEDYFSNVRGRLSQHHGVERVEVNPLTAGILLITREPASVIAEYAENSSLFRLRNPSEYPVVLSRRFSDIFEAVNNKTKSFTGGEMDIPTMAFLALLSSGIYQISRGNFEAPAWYTAFWYAVGVLTGSQKSAD